MIKKFLFLFFLAISLNVTSNEKYSAINNILLSDNILIEHKTINKISNKNTTSTGTMARLESEVKIIMTSPFNESYTLYKTYINYCDDDFNECSIIDDPQIINNPFFYILKNGLTKDDDINDYLVFDNDIEPSAGSIKINLMNDKNLVLTYVDTLGIINKVKLRDNS